MYAALSTALAKQPGSVFVAVGTRPEDETHWFSEMLKEDKPGVYRQVHAASEGSPDFAMRSIQAANPAMKHMPWLREELKRSRDKAKTNDRDLNAWRALYLNKGTPEVGESEKIVSVDNWKACVFEELPPRAGPVFISFDIGGSVSMTAFTAYWPETGRFEARGAFPADPGLLARGRSDGVDDEYVRMAERGEIRTYPGKVVPVGRFLADMAHFIEGEEVIGAVADQYKKADAEQGMAVAGIRWEMTWRRTGKGPDGFSDIRAFQAEVLEARLRAAPSLLMASEIKENKIRRATIKATRICINSDTRAASTRCKRPFWRWDKAGGGGYPRGICGGGPPVDDVGAAAPHRRAYRRPHRRLLVSQRCASGIRTAA